MSIEKAGRWEKHPGDPFYFSLSNFLPVQNGLHQLVILVIAQLQGEEGHVPGQQVQEDGVPLPVGQLQQAGAGDPLQHALAALPDLPRPAVGGEQVHILRHPTLGDKGDDAPVLIPGQVQAGLLPDLPQEAVLRALVRLELAAHADPLVLVYVVLNYEVVWTSANENIATVRGGMTKATVTGVAEGTTTVTATATDKDTGASFTATIPVTVNYYPDLNDALNVQGGNLNFVSTGTYAWQIDMTTFSARLAGTSTNSGAGNSQSAVTMDTVHLSAGDKLTFAWAVSSEANYDKLKFYVNGNVVENISGETTIWNRYEYTAPSDGNYIFKWSYEKDSSVNKGQDKGWVDDISITYVNPPYTLGDVDNDGRITISDALMTMRYAMGTAALTDTQILAADFDGNGTVSITDATMILRAAMIAD